MRNIHISSENEYRRPVIDVPEEHWPSYKIIDSIKPTLLSRLDESIIIIECVDTKQKHWLTVGDFCTIFNLLSEEE